MRQKWLYALNIILPVVANPQTTALAPQTTDIPKDFGTCSACSHLDIFSVPDSNTNDVSLTDVAPESSSTDQKLLGPTPESMIVQGIENITDDTLFLSFEEWKKLKQINITNLTQSVNQISYNKTNKANQQNSTQFTTGSTNEINDKIVKHNSNKQSKLDQIINQDQDQGKLYKDKFNYASVDCAATIVKTNSQAKGASAILVENKDSYLLNQCSVPNKFVVIELCQDILIDSIVVGNFEFFSSMFHKIRFSVSDRFPTNQWKSLGEFEAANVRNLQTFNIDNPLIWTRYLQMEILSHYGSEFYCPISVLRVHGRTMMEELKNSEEEKNEALDEIITINSTLEDLSNIKTPNTSLECAVKLPHLALLDFLEDVNSTAPTLNQYCEVPESTQSVPATTQESFYKTIINRLSLLESNATLSLLYVEEQSKLLSEAFTKLERRQSQYFESLVTSFNKTMIAQLHYFKDAYQMVQHEAASLLSTQQKNHRELLNDSNIRIKNLTNELRFQKRVTIFNTFIIIVLLIYVMVTRDASIEQESFRFVKDLTKGLQRLQHEPDGNDDEGLNTQDQMDH